MLRNTSSSYGLVARLLHWIVFVLLVLVTLSGLKADDMEKGQAKLDIIGIHSSVGSLILALMAIRLFWRILNPTPDSLAQASIMLTVSKLVQMLLFILLLAQPIIGMLMAQSAGNVVSPFGLFELPALVPADKEFSKIMHLAHGKLWVIIFGLLLVHIAGSLKQHLVAKNRTLVRMIKG